MPNNATPDSAGMKLEYAETCAPHGLKSQFRAGYGVAKGWRVWQCVKGVT